MRIKKYKLYRFEYGHHVFSYEIGKYYFNLDEMDEALFYVGRALAQSNNYSVALFVIGYIMQVRSFIGFLLP